jgi:hypothetical protein
MDANLIQAIIILISGVTLSAQLSDRWKTVLQVAFVLALCAGAIVILLSLGLMRAPEGSRRVQFRVEASGGFANITLQAGDDVITKPTTVTTPWSKTIQLASGTEVYLTASNPTQTGKITCMITLDRTKWKTDTTTAPKDGVACAGIVP